MNKRRVLWALFVLEALLTLLSVVRGASGALKVIITFAPALLLALHACWTLTIRRGLSFIFLAGFVGFAAEAISLHFGTFFGATPIHLKHPSLGYRLLSLRIGQSLFTPAIG